MSPVSNRLDPYKIDSFTVTDELLQTQYKLNYCDQIAISRLMSINDTLRPDVSFIVNNMNKDDIRKLVKMKIIRQIRNSLYQFDKNFYSLLKEA